MKTRTLLHIILISLITGCLSFCGKIPAYKDSSLPVEKRVEDLLSRMTLEEKAAQLDMLSANDILVDSNTLNSVRVFSYIDSMNIGAIHDLYPCSAAFANSLQRRSVEKSRLGIPLLFIEEALHGYQGTGATTFPVPQGNASTWNTTLVRRIGRAIAAEARSRGVHFVLGPNLDLARDIRWGRVEETFGEDVYLVSRMAVDMIKGLHGDSLANNNAVVSEPKHFAMHGAPENGSNESPVFVGEREARSTGLYVFEKAVKEAGAKGIMAAYHEIDGIPCVSNKWLLTDVLRTEWGFDGMVVTDLGAIKKQIITHKTATDSEDAILKALSAGLDMQFYDFPHTDFQRIIVESVKRGTLAEADLNRAVKDVLRVKFILGLFDNPYTDETLSDRFFHSKEHQELALEAARQSIVLLKNDNNTLPLNSTVISSRAGIPCKTITLTGNLANASYTGGYSPAGAQAIGVYDALRKQYGDKIKINYINTGVSDRFSIILPSFLSSEKQPDAQGLKADFFNNKNFNGDPVYTCVDGDLNHYWHNLSPAPGVDPESFSARWSGYLSAPVSGTYEFNFRADGYGKILIDNKVFIDHCSREWQNVEERKTIRLEAGRKIPFCLEFSKLSGNADIWLKWRLTDTEKLSLYSDITRAASQSDAVVVVIGEAQEEVGESRDKHDLYPNAMDMKVLQAAVKSGKPVITVMITGRPLILTEVCKLSDAVLQAWFGGEAAGMAIADILTGNCNPSGRLAVTFPENQGQLPMYYSKKPSAHRRYIDGEAKPLFPFGFGLSYSSFEYSNLKISPEQPSINDTVTVGFDVRNTGAVDGYETAQLYIDDKVSSVSIPEKQLKGFSKVFIKAGETKSFTIILSPEQLSLVNAEMKRVVEPGEFEIAIGASSEDIRLRKTFIAK
ncbi:MAG: glycoside hydrolase family 3 C-terminal domain-containing protein [Dysgonamonadaceae bacterium]|jgi:beta-glucosidase|nr:glycoside hydrolase family 3 C-terminal domain-containing protein [Dysgonamonadaceae bacterium]